VRTISYKLDDLKKAIIRIGYVGENQHTQVRIDCKDLFKEYPDAAVSAAIVSPAGQSYPKVVTVDGSTVVWDVTDSDLAAEGDGEIQLTFTEGGVVAKTAVARFNVYRSITADGPAPDPVDDWLQEASEALEDIEAAEVNQPIIGQDGYWYTWDQEAGKYVKTNTKAQGEDGQPGHTPEKGVDYWTAADKAEMESDVAGAIIDDTSTALDKTWSASKSNTLLNALTQSPKVAYDSESGVDLDLIDENGNVLARFKDGHFQTKEFDSKEINATKETTAQSDLDIIDENRNVILRLNNGHIQTKNFNSELNAGIIGKNAHVTDGVYASCRYHQPNSTSKQFCMLIAGDTHTDPTRMNSLIEYLNAVDAFDAGIMLGDMSGNTFSDSIEYYTSALMKAQKPFLTVIGNHDVVNATSDSDLYTKYGGCFQYADLSSGESVSGKCYYYKDFATYKIRIIVLMQYDYTYTGNLCFGQDQIDWLITTLNSTPSDYGVIIAEHTNPSRYMTYDLDDKYTSSTWYQSNYSPTVMSGDPVPDIVDAWIDGGTLSQTYSYTFDNPPTALSVSADFTSRGAGEFITYLGGHWHMDVFGHPTSYADQPDYHVPAAGLSAATQGDIPRKVGTVSEDSFCALGVDRDKKTVKIFHIGAHYTKDAVDRRYFKYGYGT